LDDLSTSNVSTIEAMAMLGASINVFTRDLTHLRTIFPCVHKAGRAMVNKKFAEGRE
jgi:hypothetical protein